MDAPNANNYTLGKGVAFFNKKDQATGLYAGARDLGNAPDLSFNLALDVLEHFSSRGGLKAKDQKVISQITPKLTFTLDEINAANLALLMMASVTEVNQVAGDVAAESLALVNAGMHYDLSMRNVGVYALTYNDLAADNVLFTEGEVVTGAGGGEGTVAQIIGDATSGTLYLTNFNGTDFVAGEVLTGDVAGIADAVAAQVWMANVSVEDADTPGTFYTMGTDYTVNAASGRIMIVSGGAIVDGTNLEVTFSHLAETYKMIEGLTETTVEGEFTYISDNPVGGQLELRVWRLSLTPTGDTAFIGDDWSTLGFEGEILKDETNHADNPYLEVILPG